MQVKDYAAELVEPHLAPLSGILRPEDEIRFWTELSTSNSCPQLLQKRAAAITSVFAPVQPKLQQVQRASKDMSEEKLLDIIDDMHDVLDALWELEAPDAPGMWH